LTVRRYICAYCQREYIPQYRYQLRFCSAECRNSRDDGRWEDALEVGIKEREMQREMELGRFTTFPNSDGSGFEIKEGGD
jgi:hypothetical protein